jgi:hypothetical protein
MDKVRPDGTANFSENIHCKKSISIFPSPAGVTLANLSLGGNNLTISSRESLVSDIPDGDGKSDDLFLQCRM